MKQIVKPGDRVYCPFCGDSYDADELVSSHRSPQVEMRCASCGREFEFVVDETSSIDLIKIYFDFRNDFCVSVEFGSYAARNMFP